MISPTFIPIRPSFDPTGMSLQQRSNYVISGAIQRDPSYRDSVMLASNYSLSQRAYESAMTARDTTDRTRQVRYQEMRQREFSVRQYFEARSAVHKENFDFKNGHQWSDDDIARLAKLNQPPYVSPHMWRWVMHMLGEQRGMKTQFMASPRSPQHAEYAELFSSLLNHFADENEWMDEESMVFDDGAVGGVGVSQVILDPHDPSGNILMRRVQPLGFIWDYHTARNGSLDDATWIGREYAASLEDFMLRYPMFADEFQKGAKSGLLSRIHEQAFMHYEPRVSRTTRTPGVKSAGAREFFNDKRMLWITEWYTRRRKRQFRVTDSQMSIDHDFDLEIQAADFYRNIRDAYAYSNFAQTGQEIEPLIVPPREIHVKITDLEVYAGETLIDIQQSESWNTPYDFYIPMWNNNEISGFFEQDKSHERMRNRLLIFFDMLASGVKGKTAVNLAKLPKDLRGRPQEVKRIMNQPTELLFFNDPSDGAAENVIKHYNPPNHGSLPAEMLSMINSGSASVDGGPNSRGLTEYSGQSGRSQIANQRASSTANIPLFDSLRKWQTRAGKRTAHLAQFVDPNIQIATTSNSGEIDFRSLASEGIRSVSAMGFKIEVQEVVASPSVREMLYSQLVAVLQSTDPATAQAVIPELLEAMQLPASSLKRITARLDAQQQSGSEQAQREAQLAEYEATEKWRLAQVDRDLKKEKNDIERTPAPRGNWSVKLPPTPALESELLQRVGIAASPLGVLADHSLASTFEQAVDDRRLIHTKKIAPETLGGGGKNGGSRNQRSTAKDKINRNRKRGSSQ